MIPRKLVARGTIAALGVAAALCLVAAIAAIADADGRWVLGALALGVAALSCGVAGSFAVNATGVWRQTARSGGTGTRPARAVSSGASAAPKSTAKPPSKQAGKHDLADKSDTLLWPAWPQQAAVVDPPVPWVAGGPFDEPYAAVWRDEVARRPSYMYKLAESKRRLRLVREFGATYDVMRHNSKADGYRLAERCGVAVPELFVPTSTIDALDFDALPDRAVVKTVSGANNRGIHLLVRQGPDRYLDLMDSTVKTSGEIRAAFQDLVERKLVSATLQVEELLEPRADVAHLIDIPDDLKIYCFDDRVVGLMQRRMNGTADRQRWTFKFWTADWRDLGPVKYTDRLDLDLEKPSGGDAVLEAAERIAREMAVPYVRLDLYDTARGPVFGEISPHPGPPEVWRADVDEYLGREWELAEARIMARGRATVVPREQAR